MRETLISVDVETAGPNPGTFSMLSIGACLVDDPSQGFYVELKPLNDNVTPEAFSVAGLTLEHLRENGREPSAAMLEFESWVNSVVPAHSSPVFVGFNAAFDWMFVCDYFERFLARNPFGHAALDIKSFYMGKAGGSWAETSMRFLSPRYLDGRALSHNALGDARDQAALFSAIRLDISAKHTYPREGSTR
ncbi:MAG: 3'-5' exonuclease [Terrimesophilobacter sp.]